MNNNIGRVTNLPHSSPPRNASEANELGGRLATLIQSGGSDQAYAVLAPTLAQRTPFRLLDRIGRVIGASHLLDTNLFLERIAAGWTEGGWVVIGSALGQQLDHDLDSALTRCRACIVAGDAWYAADILAARVPGPGLVAHFEPTLARLSPWRNDQSRWVRRAVGVAIHFWAKRSRGAPELAPQADALLSFLEPSALGGVEGTLEERDLDAVKGIGWGLKTLGRHYPDLVAGWLEEQLARRNRHPRALMLRKATAYLPAEHCARLIAR